MNGGNVVRCAFFLLAVVTLPMQLWSAGWCAAEVAGKAENLEVTPSLVREIQFMLLRLGMEPGPIDGVIGPQTTGAWRKFQQDTGLPQTDLVNGSKIPAAALTRLRSEASRVIFEGERRAEPPAAAPPPQRSRSRRCSRQPRHPIASPRAPFMPKILRSAQPNTPPKNICRKGSTAQLRARFRC